MAEWSIAAVLKTVVLRGTRGSNPCLSAIKKRCKSSNNEIYTFFICLKLQDCLFHLSKLRIIPKFGSADILGCLINSYLSPSNLLCLHLLKSITSPLEVFIFLSPLYMAKHCSGFAPDNFAHLESPLKKSGENVAPDFIS